MATFDRLGELRGKTAFSDLAKEDDDLLEGIDLSVKSHKKSPKTPAAETNSSSSTPQEGAAFLKGFYDEIAEVRTTIQETYQMIDKLNAEYEKTFTSVIKPGALSIMRKGFEKQRIEIKQNSSELKKYIELLGKKNKEMSSDPIKAGSSEHRIRENQYKMLTQEVMDLMAKYEKVQNNYKNRHEQNLKRQIKLTYQIEDDAKIEKILKSEDFREDQLLTGFFLGKATQHTINTEYNEIKETKQDLQNLALNLSELQDMFKDFVVLLSLQQETMDSIEKSVNKSEAAIVRGTKNIKKAEKYLKKTTFCNIL